MALGKLADPDSVDLSLGVDSDGLGVFDAFFASLSIILVSEVGASSSCFVSSIHVSRRDFYDLP